MMKFKTKPNRPQLSEGGYTIIESLVAMIMVSTLMAAIAPIIALSVGTRVQARRVELAAQAARSYIDGVRSGTIPAPTIEAIDPGNQTITGPGNLGCPNPPDTTAYCSGTADPGVLYCVDGGDGGDCNGLTDMVVHAVGFSGASLTADDGYELFVRVYRGSGVENATLSPELILTSTNNTGLATRSGDTEKPLFKTKTEITPTQNSFQNYRDRLD
ncbi:MAG: hormogonium polysaccharide secretion pseudopilin HpsB [Trichodesmium sp. MO_231.B1]|nr:hormogonium polysaccharide secretion pseudopilin HpsB [Trichodesmium sp. MO_231.B1]